MIKHMNCTYNDAMNIPTYERRFFIDTLRRENTMQKEKMQEARDSQSSQTGKGKRTRKISGNAVKEYSGKI
jgi:hypothetical protein